MPAHRDEAQSRWQMWEPEYSCEAGVPSVLADEILVCSKQPQGHSLLQFVVFPSQARIVASHILAYLLSWRVGIETKGR